MPQTRPLSLGDDVRTLLAATTIDVCAAAGVPYCAVSRVRGDEAIVAAAQGAGPAGFVAGATWRIPSPPARQALTTGRVVMLAGRDDPRMTSELRTALTGHDEMLSLAFVPLLAPSLQTAPERRGGARGRARPAALAPLL